MLEMDTAVEPAMTGVTAPTPWSIEAETALVVVHESAEASPAETVEGFALKVHAGVAGGVTTIACWQVTEPPGPVAVSEYVLEDGGETVVEPFAVTEPIPWLMTIEVAFVVVHERTDEPPGAMVVGFALSVQVGAGLGVMVTVTPQSTVPPGPVAVIV